MHVSRQAGISLQLQQAQGNSEGIYNQAQQMDYLSTTVPDVVGMAVHRPAACSSSSATIAIVQPLEPRDCYLTIAPETGQSEPWSPKLLLLGLVGCHVLQQPADLELHICRLGLPAATGNLPHSGPSSGSHALNTI